MSLVNLDVTTILRPRVLPKLQFDQGIPDACRTLVVVPTLLTSAEAVRKLAGGSGDPISRRTRIRTSISPC